MKKYYAVEAKCGHVGRGNYFKGIFYETAESEAEAAAIVRRRGRVKHDHKDAILSVREITKEEYKAGRKEKAKNPYYSCSNVQQQRQIFDLISEYIMEEDREYADEHEQEEKRMARIRYKMLKNKVYNVNVWEEAYAI